MPPDLVLPPKVSRGDRVAVISPSFAAPGMFPAVHELGMRRLREDLGLVPVEYPTTRRLGASPQDRAADLNAAFADPSIRAVLTTIGGDDQLTVLPHLDPAPVRADPKPFFGYSDNTNLLNWLWSLDVAGYHGGSTMVHLGRSVAAHPVSIDSLRAALFDRTDLVISPVPEFCEDEIDWADPDFLATPQVVQPSPDWHWHNPTSSVTAPTWGGNLEILHWNLAASRWIRPVADYAGAILLLETSEEMPSADEVFRMLRNAGERGLLAQFPAVLVALPKASSRVEHHTPGERACFRADQRDAVLRAFEMYNPTAMIVIGPDFGHTDPQWVLPYGGAMTVDGPARRITAHY